MKVSRRALSRRPSPYDHPANLKEALRNGTAEDLLAILEKYSTIYTPRHMSGGNTGTGGRKTIMGSDNGKREEITADGETTKSEGAPRSEKKLTVQQRLMKHPILLLILIPGIYLVFNTLIYLTVNPAFGTAVGTAVQTIFEIAFAAAVLIWIKHGTGITFGYTPRKLGKALLLLLPFVLIFCFVNVVRTPDLIDKGGVLTLGVIAYALLQGAAPGFFEELACRGLGVTSMMDVWRNRSKVIVMSACWSAVFFGLFHIINFFQGDFWGTLGQIIYATGLGVMFAGVYLRTHNLLACAIMHGLIDASSSVNSILSSGLGIISSPTSARSLVGIIVIALIMCAYGLFLIRRKKQDEIRALWYPSND